MSHALAFPRPLLLLLALLAAWLPASGARAESGTVFVLDGSSSMSSKVGGQSKMGMAQDAIGKALADDPAGRALIAFGHSSGNSCDDVSVVVPPAADMTEDKRAEAIGAIRARGAAPIARAIETALGEWPKLEPLHVVLFADGTDTCGGDAEAAAKRVVEERGGRVDVIGMYATQPHRVQPLESVAKAGGGEFTLVSSVEKLTAALDAALAAAPKAAEAAASAEADSADAPDGEAATDAPEEETATEAEETPDPEQAEAEAEAEAEAVVEDAEVTGSIGEGPSADGPEDKLASAETEATGERADGAATQEAEDAGDAGSQEVDVAQAGIPLPPPRPGTGNQAPESSMGPLQIQPEQQNRPSQQRLSLKLTAHLTDGSPPLPGGVIWRLFKARPKADGSYEVVERSETAQPVFLVPEGDYIVHAAYGRASTARQIGLHEAGQEVGIVLEAGGLKIAAAGSEGAALDDELIVSIHSSVQDEYGQRKLILENAPIDRIVRLNPGAYHLVSRYGDANAVVRADVRVKPGMLTEATVTHRAAAVTFKLVDEPGGEALANTAWSILSPGGDVVKESFGAFPVHVLAAGDYAVVARNDGRTYTAEFSVSANEPREVEVLAK